MSLHTRGYRPKPGEREGSWFRGPVSARSLWPAWWAHVRVNRYGPDRREDGTVASRLNRLARECLDAREALDPLAVPARLGRYATVSDILADAAALIDAVYRDTSIPATALTPEYERR